MIWLVDLGKILVAHATYAAFPAGWGQGETSACRVQLRFTDGASAPAFKGPKLTRPHQRKTFGFR
jgi:hypothetical protein